MVRASNPDPFCLDARVMISDNDKTIGDDRRNTRELSSSSAAERVTSAIFALYVGNPTNGVSS